jgi:multicomponent Na+:H+ antiporter subunit C
MVWMGHFNYGVVIALMMTGFYVLMARKNLVKKILGLNVFQAAVILLYVSMGKVAGGTAAILLEPPGGHGGHEVAEHAVQVVYSNPLPHVLMLTAIVVGVATTALGLALVVRIQEAYGTIEEDEIRAIEEGRIL